MQHTLGLHSFGQILSYFVFWLLGLPLQQSEQPTKQLYSDLLDGQGSPPNRLHKNASCVVEFPANGAKYFVNKL